MNLKIIVTVAGAFVVAGCSQKPPECFAPETIELVKDIVTDMAAAKDLPLASKSEMTSLIQIGTPVPTAYDKDVQRFSCEGSIAFPTQLPPSENINEETDPETLRIVQHSDGILCPGNQCQTMITFTSQTVNDRHVVSVQGLPRWFLDGIGLRAQVQAANKKAQPLADEVSKKKRLVSTCDNPGIVQQLKVSYAEKLFKKAEQQLAMNGAPFSPIAKSTIEASTKQLEEALTASQLQKVRFNLNPVSLECSGRVSLTASPEYHDDVEYLVEPVDGSNGTMAYVSVTPPEFSGEQVGYQNLIDMRAFLLSRITAGQNRANTDIPTAKAP